MRGTLPPGLNVPITNAQSAVGSVDSENCDSPRTVVWSQIEDSSSQASDVGSIPIARSINPDDSVDLTRLSYLNATKESLVLDGSWTVHRAIGRSAFHE